MGAYFVLVVVLVLVLEKANNPQLETRNPQRVYSLSEVEGQRATSKPAARSQKKPYTLYRIP